MIKPRQVSVAILKCDDVLDKFQGDYGNYTDMIECSFKKLNSDMMFESFDVRVGEYPSDSSLFDFYIITGSKASVYDELSWIGKLVEYVNHLDLHCKKVFGICFGHQVIALAKGCRVERSPKGWGVGVSISKCSEPLASYLKADILKLIVSHQDQVVDVTDGASIIASSAFCPYFSVQWNTNLVSIQGHPEWRKSYASALLNHRRDRISHEVIDAAMNSFELETDNQSFLKYIFDFCIR